MIIKGIDIACNDLSSSALFYIGVLELDVEDSTDESIELSCGINLLSYKEYEERTGILPTLNRNSNIVFEFEIISFDKFLYKLYKSDYNINYNIAISRGKRVISFLDPDRNTIIIKEADDNTKKQSYGVNTICPEEIITQYSTTYILDKKEE